MSLNEIWDESKPANTRDINLGDDDIREFKRAMRERLAVDHIALASEAGDTTIGYHKKTTFINQSPDPSAVEGAIILFAKDADGKSELHTVNEDGDVRQLTRLGKISITSLDIASAARGDLILRGASNFDRLAIGAVGTVLKSDGTDASWGSPSLVSGVFRNLNVTRPTAATVRVLMDEVFLSGGGYASSVDVTANIAAAAGANALDAGSEAISTAYYVWVIRKSSDGTLAALLSTSASSPTMPSGYDQKALVSVVVNDGSSDFIDFIQTGKKYWYSAWQAAASGSVGTGSWTSIDTTLLVPSGVSTDAFGALNEASGAGVVMITNDSSAVRGTSAGPNVYYIDARADKAYWALNIKTANTLYWASSQANTVYVAGFELNKI